MNNSGKIPSRFLSIGLAIFSGAGLIFEISLTRLLSTLYYPPFVFVVLSLAVLGIGLGAAIAAWKPVLRYRKHLSIYGAMAGFMSLVTVLFSVLTASNNIFALLLILIPTPYLFIGLTLATIFSNEPGESFQLYFADLIGAGLGALIVTSFIDTFGVIEILLFAATLLVFGTLFMGGFKLQKTPWFVFFMALLIFASNFWINWLKVDMASLSTQKPITEILNSNGRILKTIWNSFARTDLVDPGDGGPYQLYIDGAAGSIMPPSDDNNMLLDDIGLLPFAFSRPESVFIIGPGGGLDIWFAIRAGSKKVTAVEVNPAAVSIIKEYKNYNGDLYSHPSVNVVIDEGRSFLRRQQISYDLIFISQVLTMAAERDGYSMSENAIYTVEAFEDYFEHLSSKGQIALKLYDELTLTRALSVVLTAFEAQGLSNAQALQHLAIFLDPSTNESVPLLLVFNVPLNPDDALELGGLARWRGFTVLYLPGIWSEEPLTSIENGSITFSEVVEQSTSNFLATTDDSPFFYQFERGIPQTLARLLLILAVILVVGIGLLVNLQRGITEVLPRWSPIYFASLGFGFIVVEVAMIQVTQLFLGHPTTAISIVLGILLIGGGLGSGLASRIFNPKGDRIPALPAIGVAIFLSIWSFVWPQISNHFLSAIHIYRILILILTLFPLALLMGMPFPLGLHAVGKFGDRHIALGWAVNGLLTIIGSAGAIAIAILGGFSYVLLVGAIAYSIAAISAHFLSKKRIEA